jgi:hypothetical protein
MSRRPSPGFEEVKVLREGEIVCAITEDRRGRLSFMFGKEFVFEGEVRRTPFMRDRHLDALDKLLNQLRSELTG